MFNYKLILFILIFGTKTWAAAQFITYEGYVESTVGVPLTTSVSFKFQITNPTNTCVLYEETQNITPANGRFTARIGPGGPGTQTPPTITDFSAIFSNLLPLTGVAACSYTPAANEARGMNVFIMDGVYTSVGSFYLGANSFALNSERLGGYVPSQVLTFINPVTAPRSNADYTELLALLGGTSGQYLKTSSIAVSTPLTITGTAAAPVIGLNSSGVTATSYGSATQVPTFSVDTYGRITAASSVSITGVTPGGSASGDLSGSFPNPTVATVGGATAANINLGVTAANNAASGNVTGAIVKRDGSGNFSANSITASSLLSSVASTIGTLSSSNLSFVTNSATRATLTASGNFGIGTLTPGQTLSVAGIIESTPGSGGFKFPDGTIQTTAFGAALTQSFNPTSGAMLAGTCYANNYTFTGATTGDVVACSAVPDNAVVNGYVSSPGNVRLNFCFISAFAGGVFNAICKIVH